MFTTKLALDAEVAKELARWRHGERRIQTMQVVGLVAAVAVDQGSFVVVLTHATSLTEFTVRAAPRRQGPVWEVRRTRRAGAVVGLAAVATKHERSGPSVVARQDRGF